jgi:hypothetical protein
MCTWTLSLWGLCTGNRVSFFLLIWAWKSIICFQAWYAGSEGISQGDASHYPRSRNIPWEVSWSKFFCETLFPPYVISIFTVSIKNFEGLLYLVDCLLWVIVILSHLQFAFSVMRRKWNLQPAESVNFKSTKEQNNDANTDLFFLS